MRFAALTLVGSLALAGAAPATAAPALKLDVQTNPNLVQVWGGCGPAYHPNAWGYCVPNYYGYGYYRYPYYGTYYHHWRRWY